MAQSHNWMDAGGEMDEQEAIDYWMKWRQHDPVSQVQGYAGWDAFGNQSYAFENTTRQVNTVITLFLDCNPNIYIPCTISDVIIKFTHADRSTSSLDCNANIYVLCSINDVIALTHADRSTSSLDCNVPTVT